MAVTLVLFTAGCKKDDDGPKSLAKVFHAVQADNSDDTKAATRVEVDSENSRQLDWSAGDRILINDGVANREFTLCSEPGKPSGDFIGNAEDAHTYLSIYPYMENVRFANNTAFGIRLKSVQTAKTGSFDTSSALMSACSSTTDLTFINLMAYIKFTIEFDCYEVTLNARGKAVAGTVNIAGIATEPGAFVVEDEEDVITLLPPADSCCIPAGTYYIPVVPGEFTEGLELVFHRVPTSSSLQDRYYYKEFKPVAMKANKVYNAGILTSQEKSWNHMQQWLGEGTVSDPWQIYNFEQLKNIALTVDGGSGAYDCYRIMNDIDCHGNILPSIGTDKNAFAGHIEGMGHTISDFQLSVREVSTNYAGFLGYASGATLSGLSLEKVTLDTRLTKSNSYIGGFCGRADGVTFLNCSVSGDIAIDNARPQWTQFNHILYMGGFVGFLTGEGNSSFTDCTNNVNLTANSVDFNVYIGYFIGKAKTDGSLLLSGCTNNGSINVKAETPANSGLTKADIFIGFIGQLQPEGNFICMDCTDNGQVYSESEKLCCYGGVCGKYSDNSYFTSPTAVISGFTNNSKEIVLKAESVIAGGVSGEVETVNISIDKCRNRAQMTTVSFLYSYLGGIVGDMNEETLNFDRFLMSNCVNEGNLTAECIRPDNPNSSILVGGIVGRQDSDGRRDNEPVFANCLNKGTIAGHSKRTEAGGIIGGIYNEDTHIYCCASTGQVLSQYEEALVGGLLGDDFSPFSSGPGELLQCYWTDQTLKAAGTGELLEGSVVYNPETLSAAEMNESQAILKDSYNSVPAMWEPWTGADATLDISF